ncbi:MAG: glycosyltransferase family 4 protein [Candidatus Taylorbacteria bacterium]|nr:glycosyltransferase family 4 protein [Candidatus Taylorbacteria bacterium]
MSNASPRKKIVYVITKSNWGGAQRYVFDLATSMAASYDVTVVAGGSGPLVQRLQDYGINVLSLPELQRDTHPLKDFAVFKKLIKIFLTLKPDIVHLNSSKIGGVGSLAARCVRVPNIIFTAHGWAFNEDRSLPSKFVITVLYWITILLAHTTIVVSKTMAEQISYMPFIEGKLHLIYNGIENKIPLVKKQARNELLPHLDSKDIIVGSVGELHPIKGHIYAIEAIGLLIKKYPTLRYVIMGDGEYRKTIEHYIEKHNLGHHVILLGNIPNGASYLKAFDIFLLPSLSEAFGYVVLEAGIAQLPVIASAVGGVIEIVDDMKSGILIQPQKSHEIASAIDLLLQHKDLSKKYATELKAKIEKEYSLKIMIKKTDALYSKFLRRTPESKNVAKSE